MGIAKTIAVIGSLDTKQSELAYIVTEIRRLGCRPLLFDVSGLEHSVREPKADVTNVEIAAAAGWRWEDVRRCEKQQILDIMKEGAKKVVRQYYEAEKFQGIFSVGGMQNTFLAKSAMAELPYGFPKITVVPAMALVEVDDAMGRMDDVSSVNSVADIGGGINAITARIITNGLASLLGLMEYGSGVWTKPEKPLVGITNLGVMAEGAARAAGILRENGVDTCMFHGTMHGAVVEKLIEEGVLSGIMMLCIHDILTEALGEHSFCKVPTLKAAAARRLPMLISLSGMDVIDMSDDAFKADTTHDYQSRKYSYHNEFCVHVKTSKEEILKGAKLLADRLNAYESPVTVVIPLRGFRTFTKKGEALYDPEVDGALIGYLHENLKKEIRIVDVDANANDAAFSEKAAEEMLRLLNDTDKEEDQ